MPSPVLDRFDSGTLFDEKNFRMPATDNRPFHPLWPSASYRLHAMIRSMLLVGLLTTHLSQLALGQDPAKNATEAPSAKEVLAKLKNLQELNGFELNSLTPYESQVLTKDEAAEWHQFVQSALAANATEARKPEFTERQLKHDDLFMKFEYKVFGEKPAAGRSLYISMHGGGGAPKRVNDSQWRNQIGLYEPKEGVYVAPRAPTDTWNLWHQAHIDPLFVRLIEDMILFEGVTPDRVYLMGYSAGGDGVYQLAPRMADRFAAASMMAGHPNETQPLGLRNLPFALFMGGKDDAYQRNAIAEKWSQQLDELQKSDPQGYTHLVKIYPDKGHWMDRQDAEGVPWMAQFTRNRWPKKVVWKQDDVTHQNFYWLEALAEQVKGGVTLTAEVIGQEIRIQGNDLEALTLNLSDNLLDLEVPIKVIWNEQVCFEGKATRTVRAVQSAYAQELFPASPATAKLEITKPGPAAK